MTPALARRVAALLGTRAPRLTAARLLTAACAAGRPAELAAVSCWRDSVAGQKAVLWDRIDPRQATLLDQTLRPHLPASYPRAPRDDRVGDIAGGAALPPAAHLVYFPSPVAEPSLAADGYLAEEAPPAPFGQRVWAGGLMEFSLTNPLRVGDLASQTKAVRDVTVKERPGADPLVLVRLAIEMHNEHGLCAAEHRDLAYMKPAVLRRKLVRYSRQPDFVHELTPSEILLFRYSALSWNSHRIHYDTPYARGVEHHPGLLVHGPLTCTLLLQLLQAHMPQGAALASFAYRALSPLYCGHTLTLNGRWIPGAARQCELWAADNEGGLAMRGVATVRPMAPDGSRPQ
ncbi:hypothetical protein H4R21_002655 [Coemansia helicoidea]|uniref:Uncharacterized protein n=1 Tax=Coemansia helicoidea TaxID=1286919 RepID=A0ACC1L5X6_9FUNG|nr:hypothetical protein H4R21_002655 [Coemansia helicoidea]